MKLTTPILGLLALAAFASQAHAEQFLYARCDVSSCKRVGMTDPDTVCEGTNLNFSMGWSHATVEVYKYAGTDVRQQHDGLLAINNLNAPIPVQMGNRSIGPVTVEDSLNEMTLEADPAEGSYRNFTITYSTKEKPVTTGHAEIEFIRPWKSYVVLELANCRTQL